MSDFGGQVPPPPPPARMPEARVSLNVRAKAGHAELLRAYQREHGVTMQALMDQMLEEYLWHRGLL